MASGTTATSKVTPVTLGNSVRNKTQVFTATKVTETADSSGKKSYKVELVKYSDAKGTNPTVFGTRDANGKLTLNNNASAQDKQFAQQHLNTSKNQMESVKSKFTLDAESKQIFEKTNGSPNKAAADNPAGDGSNPINLETELAVNDKKTRNQFPVLKYPIDIAKTKQDVVKFTMLKYEAKQFSNLQNQSGLGGFSERDSKRNGIGSVVLPIPSGISDTNAASWNGGELDAAKAFAANVALTGITQGLGKAADKVGEGAEAISNNSGEAATGLAALFAAAAVGTDAGSLLSRTQGAVLNPNMELLFQGPTLRPFNFSFKMSARSQAEAKEIIGIIRFFKQGMSPQRSASNLFLKAPHTFRIQYLHLGISGKEHSYIGKIKECALQNFNVNYTPEGQYATFRDGVLVSYEITMQFQELEPVFNEDYGLGTGSNGPDKEIGY
jgi:hypothetical protein